MGLYLVVYAVDVSDIFEETVYCTFQAVYDTLYLYCLTEQDLTIGYALLCLSIFLLKLFGIDFTHGQCIPLVEMLIDTI